MHLASFGRLEGVFLVLDGQLVAPLAAVGGARCVGEGMLGVAGMEACGVEALVRLCLDGSQGRQCAQVVVEEVSLQKGLMQVHGSFQRWFTFNCYVKIRVVVVVGDGRFHRSSSGVVRSGLKLATCLSVCCVKRSLVMRCGGGGLQEA